MFPKMATAMFVETLEKPKQLMRLIPECRSYNIVPDYPLHKFVTAHNYRVNDTKYREL
jgi:hypothetical protein